MYILMFINCMRWLDNRTIPELLISVTTEDILNVVSEVAPVDILLGWSAVVTLPISFKL